MSCLITLVAFDEIIMACTCLFLFFVLYRSLFCVSVLKSVLLLLTLLSVLWLLVFVVSSIDVVNVINNIGVTSYCSCNCYRCCYRCHRRCRPPLLSLSTTRSAPKSATWSCNRLWHYPFSQSLPPLSFPCMLPLSPSSLSLSPSLTLSLVGSDSDLQHSLIINKEVVEIHAQSLDWKRIIFIIIVIIIINIHQGPNWALPSVFHRHVAVAHWHRFRRGVMRVRVSFIPKLVADTC